MSEPTQVQVTLGLSASAIRILADLARSRGLTLDELLRLVSGR